MPSLENGQSLKSRLADWGVMAGIFVAVISGANYFGFISTDTRAAENRVTRLEEARKTQTDQLNKLITAVEGLTRIVEDNSKNHAVTDAINEARIMDLNTRVRALETKIHP